MAINGDLTVAVDKSYLHNKLYYPDEGGGAGDAELALLSVVIIFIIVIGSLPLRHCN